MWICPKCGGREDFKKEVSGVVDYSEVLIYDSDGVFIEGDDYETYDQTETHRSAMMCGQCEALATEFNTKEYIEFISKHTKKDGSWSEDEVEYNKEKELELKTEMMLESI